MRAFRKWPDREAQALGRPRPRTGGRKHRTLTLLRECRARSTGTSPRVILLERPAGEAEREGLADDGGADLEEEREAAVAVEAAEDAVRHWRCLCVLLCCTLCRKIARLCVMPSACAGVRKVSRYVRMRL